MDDLEMVCEAVDLEMVCEAALQWIADHGEEGRLRSGDTARMVLDAVNRLIPDLKISWKEL